MKYNLQKTSRGSLDLCYKDACIKTTGRNADRIAGAAAIMLVLFGIAAIARAS